MNESRRMTSIARRINRSFWCRLFFAMLWLDVMVALIAGLIFLYHAERNALGPGWTPMLERSFGWQKADSLMATLDTVRYVFAVKGEESVTISLGAFLRGMVQMLQALGICELMWLLVEALRGHKQTVRILMPLEKMTQTAEQLSQAAFDEQKYHDLETAISALSPSMPEERLHTGDRELMGLETAVNNLITRMHESYRQQIRFVSDASHELRTPISVIQGYADMLKRWGSRDEKVLNESIDAIRGETQHMQKLVEQLLFLARGDAGRTQLTAQRIDLSKMVKELHEEYEMINGAHPWQVQADTPVPAMGDADMLKQAARILVDNAAKYSKDGEPITLKAFVTKDGQPAFSVQDNGTGIAAKDMPHIFERFYRADPARTRQMGGTGLGLSIAKWIVDKHGGYFNILSREGMGTRIEVVLPAKQPSMDEHPSAT